MPETSPLIGYLILGVGVVGIFALLALSMWPIVRRLPRSPVVQFSPPGGSVVEHGLMLRADRHVLAAAVLDLAVRGRVRVLAPSGRRAPIAIEVPPGAGLSVDERRLISALRPPLSSKRRQRRYLKALADIGIVARSVPEAPDVVFLTGRGAFTRARRGTIRAFFDSERKRLKSAGLVRPIILSLHLYVLSLLFLVGAVIGVMCLIAAVLNGEWVSALIFVAFLAGLFWALMLAPPPIMRFTPAGQEVRRHLSGLRGYMRLAEADRMRVLQSPEGALLGPIGSPTPGQESLGMRPPAPMPNDAVAAVGMDRYLLDERLLPYASLFRLEKQWQREFDAVGRVDVQTQQLRALATTLDGIGAAIEGISAALHVVRFIGAIASLVGRASD